MRIICLAVFGTAALAAAILPADGEVLITIDTSAQRMTVAVDGGRA